MLDSLKVENVDLTSSGLFWCKEERFPKKQFPHDNDDKGKCAEFAVEVGKGSSVEGRT